MFGNNSQFDSFAAFSGGGFVPSQSTQGPDASLSSAKSRDQTPLLPLTMKQISQAVQSSNDKSSFLIDGIDVSNVRVVGMAFKKAERVTDVSFVIDDGTGRIECNRWLNDSVDNNEVAGVLDGMYVVVHGHLKSFQGKMQIMSFAIRPVTDYNMIANHFLECIYVHHCNAKPKIQSSLSTQNPTEGQSQVNTQSNGYNSTSTVQFSGQKCMDGLKGIEKMVMDYLHQPSSIAQEKGMHRNEIAQQLKVPLEKILEAIESLEAEGLVYSTIDECHYKSTSA
ncbi:replication protein A 32 kDa subunit A-like isoform X1 [Ipomoea triloba]|uniref:replication protein A 32 kDa subunit A-like isoform X1 n=2 Tax=Ipomoea triloba TaxID=35885 RepID=UPI00125D35E9|nr:replication protein A 32 kDa subunit A-like isoform X1 [Ipomoea triloba]XP_031108284.1 replication protein A 32 kDa subunit A-like isoform X1 [Ipomoea triloba]